MTKRTWKFELEDRGHIVELDHPFLRKPKITVDGQSLDLSSSSWKEDFDGDYSFQIGKHKGVVHIYSNCLSCLYYLTIDGRSPTTGRPPDIATISKHYKKGHVFMDFWCIGSGLVCLIFGENWLLNGIPLQYVGILLIIFGIFQLLMVSLGGKEFTRGPFDHRPNRS
ncbi:hypothetical protein [Acaryochloris sp. IP29b_bin.137]|uniref:hypothetical protein n=1 Tax=Acaryochloris sp. IP29b_bin.137 TaxID=2969217 RepID=UPI002625B5E0|nr:hypothetical protein [Acaryochloris sp. IP29b_bin.137]